MTFPTFRWARVVALFLICTLVASCGLPRVGPNKREIFAGSVQQEGDAFVVVVSDAVNRAAAVAREVSRLRQHAAVELVPGRMRQTHVDPRAERREQERMHDRRPAGRGGGRPHDRQAAPGDVLAERLALGELAGGVFLGGTIHDVAQVVGAGYSVNDPTGDTATLVKLIRVAMLAPVVLVAAIIIRATQGAVDNAERPPL